jgi:hypothetical protein
LNLGHKSELDLLDLVCLSAKSHATDERDKIFALIGIADEPDYKLVPDYNKTAVEVFAEFARKAILATGNLQVFQYCDVRDPDLADRLPLWAPRWNADDIRERFRNYNFKASKNTKAFSKPSFNFKLLQLGGIQADIVKHIHHRDPRVHEDILAVFNLISDDTDTFEQRYGSDLIKPILLTLMAGRHASYLFGLRHPQRPKDDTYLKEFLGHIFFIFLDICTQIESGMPSHPRSLEVTRADYSEDVQRGIVGLIRAAMKAAAQTAEVNPASNQFDQLQDLFKKGLETLYPQDPDLVSSDINMLRELYAMFLPQGLSRTLQNTAISTDLVFYITEKGYMGVGPRCTKPGDRVCILFGGSMPYIIRPTSHSDDEYLFLGPTYVHGMMDGEVIDAWEEGNKSEESEFQETLFKLL